MRFFFLSHERNGFSHRIQGIMILTTGSVCFTIVGILATTRFGVGFGLLFFNFDLMQL